MSKSLLERIHMPIVSIGCVLVVLGFAIELIHDSSHAPLVETLVELLSLSHEQNLPTWWATCLHFSAGLLLYSIAVAQPPGAAHHRRWWILSMVFFYISIDEAIEIHENLGGLVGGSGIFYFDWVIPASIVVAALGAFYWPFLQALAPRRRRQFLVAGGLFVSGALLMELPLGWWAESQGGENLTYAMMDWVEESLELAGVSLFVLALAEHHSELER